MATSLQAMGAIGLCLSLYAVYVEHKNEEDSSYEAMCDVSERMSCSKVLMSEWGHILSQLGVLPKGHQFDLANATLGVLYFAAVFLHRLFPLSSCQAKAKVVFALTVPVVGVSLYLMYILLVVLQDICLICVSIYGVNLAVLVLSYRGLRGSASGPRTSFDRKSD
ncbi:conserved unknown protein [Ectocarpus siliculosus]|uniref:vitamin-K-epoxide reductase (warfarin-sensitive) n=1 Tax=Ectocarpus siliculosus TaxID=2880 RepID=D8LSG4_ECTSI|nr:conserved unknown protein [Ectocarpus siliculosus]|eukprot:CBN75221.1 conserved unknown protein [Ectocarpus siliculosus]